MMRDYAKEVENRIKFIQNIVSTSKVKGIVFANSGGKDAALTGILCKMACDDTVSLILPCGVASNYKSDRTDAMALSKQYNIATRGIDLAEVKEAFSRSVGADICITDRAMANVAPRLRMMAIYAVATSESRLVAGTGNRSERHLGYFTKWGDGGYDFNPIADLTATEVRGFLRYLNAPDNIINKPPSAGLYEGQTDEVDLGITYERIDKYLISGEAVPADKAIVDRYHEATHHKRRSPLNFGVGE
ncbi:MAG: NAD(+) synthase [Defluviitaleaceae bacterium]|nr:NAD(+) synthase [Defluviitaleaceae bacterium]